MRAAKAELLKQAKASGQPRFEPADLPAFLASIDCTPESTDALQQVASCGNADADATVQLLINPGAVKQERKG